MVILAKNIHLTSHIHLFFTEFARWKTNQILLDTIDFKLL